jgi:hypothetical protein
MSGSEQIRDEVHMAATAKRGGGHAKEHKPIAGNVSAAHTAYETGQGPKRRPLPGWLPRAVKRKAGRNAAIPIPAHIRVLGARLTQEKRAEIRRKLGARLGKFADALERVTVRVSDVNGPRGGIDQVCTIKVVVSDFPSVVFEARDRTVNAAIQAALAGTERAIRRQLQRRRTKPIKSHLRSKGRV